MNNTKERIMKKVELILEKLPQLEESHLSLCNNVITTFQTIGCHDEHVIATTLLATIATTFNITVEELCNITQDEELRSDLAQLIPKILFGMCIEGDHKWYLTAILIHHHCTALYENTFGEEFRNVLFAEHVRKEIEIKLYLNFNEYMKYHNDTITMLHALPNTYKQKGE